MQLRCPECGTETEGEPWDGGECPKCGLAYFWDETPADEEWSDSWAHAVSWNADGKGIRFW